MIQRESNVWNACIICYTAIPNNASLLVECAYWVNYVMLESSKVAFVYCKGHRNIFL
jgi:hypothetical protein